MKTYVLAIAGVVLISAIITVISPSGKMGKFVKGMMKLVTLVVLVTPFVSWFSNGKLSLQSVSIDTDKTYLQQTARLMSEADEREIVAYLQKEYGVTATAEVTRSTDNSFSHKKIVIKITDFGIIGQGEHKDITYRVQAFLQEKYGCPAEVT